MLQKRGQKDCVSQRIRELALRLCLSNIRNCTHKVSAARLHQHEVSKRKNKSHDNMEERMTTRPQFYTKSHRQARNVERSERKSSPGMGTPIG